jgi:hypothetical protein
VRVCRVEHDLVVLPELLDKPAGLLFATGSHRGPQDVIDRAVAVDSGEDPLLCRIDGKSEVGIGVGRVGSGPPRNPAVPGRGQRVHGTQWDIALLGVAVEIDRLTLTRAIIA